MATECIESLDDVAEDMANKCLQDLGAKDILLRHNDDLFDTKISAGVQASRMCFLGALVEQFPTLIMVGDEAKKIQNSLWKNFLGALEKQLKESSRTRKQAVIEGALKAISSLLVNVPQEAGPTAPATSHGNRIINAVTIVINPNNVDDMSRFQALRAALQLLTRHAGAYGARLYIPWCACLPSTKTRGGQHSASLPVAEAHAKATYGACVCEQHACCRACEDLWLCFL